MKFYLIGYDLNKPRGHNDYEKLYNAIQNISGWYWTYLDSTWIVKSDKSTAAIRDILSPYLDSGDELLIVLLEGEWSSKGLPGEATKWLEDNLSKKTGYYINRRF